MYLLKRIALLFLFIAVFIACNNPVKGRNGVVFKNPADYNDYIISRQTILIKNILDLGKKADSDVDSAYGMLDSYTNDAMSDMILKFSLLGAKIYFLNK